MKKKMWQKFVYSLFPKRCIGCNLIISQNQEFLCEKCKHSLPFTGIIFDNKNTLSEKMCATTDIQYASSLLFFHKDNITQKLIHHLKYKNLPEVGEWLAQIWFEENKNNLNISKIDAVVPVPIHNKRLKKRGYNQIHLCAKKLSELLNCSFDEKVLIRTHHLKSQTQSGKYDRQQRMKGAFQRTHSKALHYLLVDDVFTTGATLKSCTTELLKIPDSQVSIFTLAMA